MAAGANDLTTLSAVKSYLRLTYTNNSEGTDDILQTLITNVSAFIETYTSRVFASSDYVDINDGTGWLSRKMAFSNYPVTAVASLFIDGISIPPAANVNASGYLFNSQFIVLNGYCFGRGFQNIQISYTAGYAVIPFDIAQACIQVVALRYREMERIGEISKVINSENVTFSRDAVSPDVILTLNQYRKVINI